MLDFSQQFDPYIPQINSDELKRMVRLYGGNYKMRKQECIEFLLEALANPLTVRKAIAALEPFEQTGLALIKQMGGALGYKFLGIGVLTSGVPIPARLTKRDALNDIARHFLSRGLILNAGYSPGRIDTYGYGNKSIFSDPRLLAEVGPPVIEPMALAAAPPPQATVARMPPTVVLAIIGFLQTLENMGGLRLTQKGELRVNDLRKFQKALQWPKDDLEVDGLIFKDALNGLIQALRHSDFLKFEGNMLVLQQAVTEVATQGYAEQVSTLVNGFLRVSEWNETSAQRWLSYGDNYQQARIALLFALAALPLDKDDFYTVDEFDRALYARIGEHFAISGSVYRYFSTYGKTPTEVRQMEAQWQTEKREKWLQKERLWIEEALSSWLYYLGMVELALDGQRIAAFRLTELGKAVLHPAQDFAVDTPTLDEADRAAGVWVVQPNFDVVVYLDRTTPTQLAFLELHAERTQSQQYTAHYRLTRDSVYRGLESGTTLAQLLADLAAYAQSPLPQNVTVEITEWAALREQVILHHRASLLEFATSAARQAALDAHVEGAPVGDRFLLLAPNTTMRTRLSGAIGAVERIDYAQPLPQILRVDEAGAIALKEKAIDLLIEAQLDHWGERTSDDRWQLTAATVAAHVKAGRRIDELIELLRTRLSRSLPKLLELALRNWAGRAKTVEVEPFVVLRCGNSTVLDAILTSQRLKPYLRGQLDDNLLIFESGQLAEVREILRCAGLKLTDFRHK